MRLHFRYFFGHRSVYSAVVGLFSLLAVNRNAWAFDESAQAKVREEYDVAVEKYVTKRYCESAKSFAQALATIPLPVLALWAARAYDKCGDLTEAVVMYDTACQLTPNELWLGDKQQNAQVEARHELELLRRRIPRVVIEIPLLVEGEVKVTIDDNALSADEYGKERFVNPGPHVIVYELRNVRTERRIVAREKQVKVVRIEEAPVTAPPHPAPIAGKPVEGTRGEAAADPPSSAVLPPKTSRVRPAVVVPIVIGGAGLVAGIVTRLLAFDQMKTIAAHCNNSKECDPTGMDAVSKADSFQTQSTIYLLIGVAGIGTGIGFALAGPEKSTTQAKLTPMVTPSGAALTLTKRF
jgi:hypothetical protein